MTSIGKRIAETMDKMEARDAEGALFQICAPIESTAVREYGMSGGKTYREFLHDNLGLITRVGLGVPILNYNIGKFTHPDIKPDAQGFCSVQQILYHAVRCGLYHEAKLPANLRFEFGGRQFNDNGTLIVPAELIYGLIAVVILSPANVGEQIEDRYGFLIGESTPLRANKMWGKRTEFLWLLDALIPRPPAPPPSQPVPAP